MNNSIFSTLIHSQKGADANVEDEPGMNALLLSNKVYKCTSSITNYLSLGRKLRDNGSIIGCGGRCI